MMVLKDQIGNTFSIKTPPQRIISLVPSQTELLYDLGLDKEVVGITKFCVHPHHWWQKKERIGGTKNVNIDKIKQLHPDLIIANKEENTQEAIEELQKYCPVWVSAIHTLEQALDMILAVGALVDKKAKALEIAFQINEDFKKITPQKNTKKVAYCIWKNPWMWASGNTFIGAMLRTWGHTNVFETGIDRYPTLPIKQLQTLQPELIFLSSEPYPFKEKDKDFLAQIFPNAQIILVDGELFSWYGSRLLKTPPYFEKLTSEHG